jgi:putative membrane protein
MLKRLFISITAAGLLVPTVALAHMMGYGYNSRGWGVGIGMFIFWLIAIFFIIGIARWIMWRGHHMGYYHHEMGNRALDILKERYAKGEITKEQYEQMKKELQ